MKYLARFFTWLLHIPARIRQSIELWREDRQIQKQEQQDRASGTKCDFCGQPVIKPCKRKKEVDNCENKHLLI